MRKIYFILLLACSCLSLLAQPKPAPSQIVTAPVKEEKKQSADISFNPDAVTSSTNEVTIKGQRVAYKVTTGTMPVWDEDGKTIAGLFLPTMKDRI